MSKVNLVELRDVRQDARESLAQAYAEDLIDAEELDRRLEGVENASDPAAVRALYEDVVPPRAMPWCPRSTASASRATSARR
jgi:hypothetical protein